MEPRQKALCLLVLFLTGLLWWGPNNRSVMGKEPIQNAPVQKNISHWLNELKTRIPKTGNSTKLKKRKNIIPLKKRGLYETDSLAKKMLNNSSRGKISVDLYKADLHNIFRLLGKVSGKNIVVDGSVKGNITLALQNVPWTFVLDVIKNLKGLDSIERYNTIMIYPAKKAVKWGGGKEASGNLKVRIKPLLIKKRPSLNIVSTKGLHTPIKEVAKAQDLIKKAAKIEKQGAIDQALNLYIKASDTWPENTSLTKKIAALALGKAGQELTAFNFARKALRFAPKDGEAATLAAIALSRMGKADEAKTYFERAMILGRPSLQTLYNYAVFCESRGKYRQALHLLDDIEDNYKVSAGTMLLKARAYEGIGQKKRALTEYRAVLLGGSLIPLREQQYARKRVEDLTVERKRQ